MTAKSLTRKNLCSESTVAIAILMLTALASSQVQSDEAPYQLACIRVDNAKGIRASLPENRILLFSLDEKGEPIGSPRQILNAAAWRILPNGQILQKIDGRYDQFFITLQPPVSKLAKAGDVAPLSALTTATLFLDEKKAWAMAVAYLREHAIFDPSTHEILGGFVDEWYNMSFSPSGTAVVKAYIDVKNGQWTGEFAPKFQVLLLVDMAHNEVRHICGTDKERYFFNEGEDVLANGKVTFFRNLTYISIAMSQTAEDNPKLAESKGWQLCCYDVATHQLNVLYTNPYMFLPSTGGVLWSPDAKSLLFSGTPEKNKSPRLAIYHAEASTVTYPLGDLRAVPLNWAPDSRRFLADIQTPLQDKTDAAPRGYYVADIAGKLQPLLPVDEKGKAGNLSVRQDFAWSPDGKFIAFYATLEEAGQMYSGLFVVPTDGSGPSRLLDRAAVEPRVKGKSRVVDYFKNPFWIAAE